MTQASTSAACRRSLLSTLARIGAKCGDYYYYLPGCPGATPADSLAEVIKLTENYTDVDGGHQSIDVIAEAIQAGPEAAVKAAWGDNFSMSGDNLVVPAGN